MREVPFGVLKAWVDKERMEDNGRVGMLGWELTTVLGLVFNLSGRLGCLEVTHTLIVKAILS